jgi:hypothetical protein
MDHKCVILLEKLDSISVIDDDQILGYTVSKFSQIGIREQ